VAAAHNIRMRLRKTIRRANSDPEPKMRAANIELASRTSINTMSLVLTPHSSFSKPNAVNVSPGIEFNKMTQETPALRFGRN